ncbi:MAG: chemotaxis protein CheA [Spirochaetota bacterium]|nr:chemotaxis protein CheA [Spirochaetota bacterium]
MKRDDLSPEIIKNILDESRELITELDLYIIDLEKNPDKNDQINKIFRAFHSIKGTTGNIDEFIPISKFAHQVETLLSKLRAKELRMNHYIGTILLSARDMIQDLLIRAGENENIEDINTNIISNEIQQIIEGKAIAEEESTLESSTIETLTSKRNSIRVDIDRIDKLINCAGEVYINERMLKHQILILKNKFLTLKNNIALLKAGQGDRNYSDVYELQKVFSDLLMSFEDLSEKSDEVDFVSDELKSNLLQMRMVPIQQLFNRAIRIARDISIAEGKEVNIQSFGEETEVDRKVIEEMYDPLVHIIRNAIDHGIELSEEREEYGKTHVGNIILKAFYHEGSVVIEASDDGRGIDIEGIKKKAVFMKLYSENSIEKMTEEDVLNTIFLPGFSTKDMISEISGRGVGMDVLMENVKKLKGDVKVTSEKGEGTTFSITLPLTLVMSEVIIIEVSNEIYTIPIDNIIEIVKLSGNLIRNVGERYTLSFNGKSIPVIDLNSLFIGESYSPIFNEDDVHSFVVVNSLGRIAALYVDRVICFDSIVVKGMGSHISRLRNFQGATILEDGNVSLILNIDGILTEMDEYFLKNNHEPCIGLH